MNHLKMSKMGKARQDMVYCLAKKKTGTPFHLINLFSTSVNLSY